MGSWLNRLKTYREISMPNHCPTVEEIKKEEEYLKSKKYQEEQLTGFSIIPIAPNTK